MDWEFETSHKTCTGCQEGSDLELPGKTNSRPMIVIGKKFRLCERCISRMKALSDFILCNIVLGAKPR